MTRAGSAIAVLGVIAAVVIVGAVFAMNVQPTIPGDAGSTLVARTVLHGAIAPDASEGIDPNTLPRSPVGQECLDAIVRPAGPLSLCWEAYRDPYDADSQQDYYILRVYGTFGGESGTGVRWAAVRARLVGEPLNNVFEAWPDATFTGPCRQVEVSLHSAGPLPVETLCGLTTGSTNVDDWSHRVVWSCVGCLIADHANRAIVLYEFVGVPPGSVPEWEIFADLGS